MLAREINSLYPLHSLFFNHDKLTAFLSTSHLCIFTFAFSLPQVFYLLIKKTLHQISLVLTS